MSRANMATKVKSNILIQDKMAQGLKPISYTENCNLQTFKYPLYPHFSNLLTEFFITPSANLNKNDYYEQQIRKRISLDPQKKITSQGLKKINRNKKPKKLLHFNRK